MSNYEQRAKVKNGKRKTASAREPSEPLCNLDAERVVCATFMAKNFLWEKYAEKIDHTKFHDPFHTQVMETGARLVIEGKPANRATVGSYITELSSIPDLSTGAYLKELDKFIRIDQIETYIDQVNLYAKRRAVRTLAEQFQAMAATADHDIIEQLSSAVALLSGAAHNVGLVHMGPFVEQAFQDVLYADAADWGPTGYLTGFPEIDDAIGGLKKGKFYVFAGMEKAGKSALGLSVARQLLLQDIPVAIFSLEMKHGEVAQRLIMMESGISVVNRKKGHRLTGEESVKLSEAADRVEAWKLYENDLSSLTPAAITMNARHAVRTPSIGAKVIIVDYLQIVNSEDDEKTRDDTRRRVEKASRAMARLAKELDVPLIALAQLNREALKRNTAATFEKFDENACRPRRGDIRETAQVEMDADAIVAIYRPEIIFKMMRPFEGSDQALMIDFDEKMHKMRGKAELSVLVNRSGPDGVRCNCRYIEQIMLFEPYARKV
jgi:replicative DNA helicase